jgi:glucan biosynthesis protein C
MQARRHDIDTLRILATAMLFIVHSMAPYTTVFWLVKDRQTSVAFDVGMLFIIQVHMPLFFLLSGWSIARASHSRRVRALFVERAKRILVPFAFGIPLACVPSAYIMALTQQHYHDTFGHFFTEYFTTTRHFLVHFYYTTVPAWHHLWFLPYLATFTFLTLPFVARLRAFARSIKTPSLLHLVALLVPLLVVQLLLRWRWPVSQNLVDDWANLLFFWLIFVAGVVLAELPQLEALIVKVRALFTVLFVLAFICMLPFGKQEVTRMFALADGAADRSPVSPYVLFYLFTTLATFFGTLACLGWGRALRNVDGPTFLYLREISAPVYVLHNAVVVLLAYALTHVYLHVAVKYLVLATSSAAVTLLICELCVRRIPMMRFALGMKPRALDPLSALERAPSELERKST